MGYILIGDRMTSFGIVYKGLESWIEPGRKEWSFAYSLGDLCRGCKPGEELKSKD
jgi:hypothetical protein